ncbi:sensor histidine kinase [Metasolibacillus meyeri]|uniref:sensor histidine kinase n=1 Tax=Metasolibacillus meyeri TaxID=1071052 RepID=UPI000D2FF296|nr:GHKL domain-containing protein [Metasolibacillus meyeri]
MLFYQLATFICIGIGHIYLFNLFAGNTKAPMSFTVFLSVLLCLLLNIIIPLFGMMELNIVVLLAFLVLLGTMYKKHTLAHTIYFALISIVLYTGVRNGLFTISLDLYMDSPFNYYIWTNLAIGFYVALGMLIVLFLMRNWIASAGDYLIHSKLYIPSFIFLIISLILLLIINYPTIQVLAEINVRYGRQLYVVILLMMIILLLITTVSIYVSKERLIDKYEQSQHQQLMEYVEKLEFMHDELATFRHDYSNLLLSLEASIHANDLQQIKQIYEYTIAPTAVMMNHQQLELTKLAHIQQPELKSILSVKTLTAQRQQITVHLDIPQNIKQVAMSIGPFIRVISVLLDNAIEEAVKSTAKTMQIALFEVKDAQYFIVRNSVDSEEIEVEQLYTKNYSTKGNQRGYGLFSVQRIVKQYPNTTLLTSVDTGMFSQELIVKK